MYLKLIHYHYKKIELHKNKKIELVEELELELMKALGLQQKTVYFETHETNLDKHGEPYINLKWGMPIHSVHCLTNNICNDDCNKINLRQINLSEETPKANEIYLVTFVDF